MKLLSIFSPTDIIAFASCDDWDAANPGAKEVPTLPFLVFEREAKAAQQAATDASLALSRAVDAVVTRHALDLLTQRRDLAHRLADLDRDLLSFEQYAAPTVPRQITEFVLERHAAGTRVALHDTAPWRELHQWLSGDPEAVLDLA